MGKRGWNWILRDGGRHYFTDVGASLCGERVIDRNNSIPNDQLGIEEIVCKRCQKKLLVRSRG